MALEDIKPATREEEFLDRIARAAAANIPAAPTTAGNYSLKCTVNAQGEASYAWVADPV